MKKSTNRNYQKWKIILKMQDLRKWLMSLLIINFNQKNDLAVVTKVQAYLQNISQIQ